MIRILTHIFATVLSLIAVLIPTLVYTILLIAATDRGTQFAWQRVQTFLTDTVEIREVKGCLATPLTLRGLTVKTETFQLKMDRIELEWRPSQLLHRILTIKKIEAEGVRFTQLQAPQPEPVEKSSPFILPDEIVLPVGVQLKQLTLHHFEFYSAPESGPFIIESAKVSATAIKHNIDLSELSIHSPLFQVKGNTSLTAQGDYPVSGKLHWQIPVPGYPVVNGTTSIAGNLQELDVTQTLLTPYNLEAEAVLKDLLGDLSFKASLQNSSLKLQSINKELPAVTVQISASGQGDPGNINFNLAGWAETVETGKLNATLDGGFKTNTITINELAIKGTDHPTELTAKGQIAIGGTSDQGNRRIDLDFNWRELQWPLKQPEIQSPEGNVILTGNMDNYSLNMKADIVVPAKTSLKLQAEGQGDLESFELSRFEAETLEGKVDAKGHVTWSPELKGDVDLVGQGLNPGAILQDWPGKLDIAIRAKAGLIENQPDLQLQELTAKGTLRGYELSLDSAGIYQKNQANLQRFMLSSGTTKLDASGRMGDTFDINYQIDSEDLGTLVPNGKGRLKGRGTLSGPTKTPRLKTMLSAEGLAYADYSLKSLNLETDVDLTGNNRSKVSLNLEDGKVAGVKLHKLALSGLGDLRTHSFTLTADTSSGQADIALHGSLHNPWEQEMLWDFTLDQASLKYPDLDGWVLQEPTSGHITAKQQLLNQGCWKSGASLLCLEGRGSTETVQADLSLKNLPFSYFTPYLPPDIEIQGSLSGESSLRQDGGEKPIATLDLKTTELHLFSKEKSEQTQQDGLIIAFEPGEIQAQVEHGGMQARAMLPLSKNDHLQFQATVSPGDGPIIKLPLAGKLTADIGNLDFIAELLPDLQKLRGTLKGDMAIAGSLASPVLNGRLTLTEAGAELERPGLDLKDIEVTITGTKDGAIQLKGHATSGGGGLNIDGRGDLRGDSATADIRVVGENFRLLNTLEAQVDVSPDLTLALRRDQIKLGGEIVIPSADIKVKELPESAISTSGDQLIIESEQQREVDETGGRNIEGRVRLILGDKVKFEGFGLKARIEGNILAIEKPVEPTTASGKLMILDGEYRAYGQGLVIEKGHILFAGGPIDQPGLDVQAVRRPEKDITVGVQVRGNLRQPDFKLFSEPTMTQGNQLSYLVLGRPLSGSSSKEGSALRRAALALGLQGGNLVAQKIGSTLGLDEFGIAPTEAGSNSSPEQASFVVGKYLSPKLYVSYGLGLFEPISTLRLQYAISSHWELVTESSGAASGGDVIYTIETGK